MTASRVAKLGIAILSIFSSPVRAEDFCAPLRTYVDASKNKFLAIRGEPKYYRDGSKRGQVNYYEPSPFLPGSDSCMIIDESGVTCGWSFLNRLTLNRSYESLINGVRGCYKNADVAVEKSGEGNMKTVFRILPILFNGADIGDYQFGIIVDSNVDDDLDNYSINLMVINYQSL